MSYPNNAISDIDAGPRCVAFTIGRMDAVDLFVVVEELDTPYSKRLADALFWGLRSGDAPIRIEVLYDGPWQSWYPKFPEQIPDKDWFTDYQIDLLQAFVDELVENECEVDA